MTTMTTMTTRPQLTSVGSPDVTRVALADLPRHPPRAWRDDLATALAAGGRLVALHGERVGDVVVVTAAVTTPAAGPDAVDAPGPIALARTELDPAAGYHALTADHPAAHALERELHEQHGVRLPGHPWLKPIRYEGQDQAAMASYPYHLVEGKDVHEVAVGPIHAGVIEPGSFRFMCHGERVHHLEIQLGYQHRGVEARLREVAPAHRALLCETIAGDTSIAHAWACCAALEALADHEVTPALDLERAIVLELERVAMHLAGLAGLAADIGHLQGATAYGRLRTLAINTTMRLCGSRFGRGALRPGVARLRWTPALRDDVAAQVASMRHDLAIIDDAFLTPRTVGHRLHGVGVLTLAQARALDVTGLTGRASGRTIDLRQGAAAGAYHAHPLAPSSVPDGDCWARGLIRIRELAASLAWLAAVVPSAPASPAPRRPPPPLTLAPDHLVIARVEGWRGEVVHTLRTDAAGQVVHHKVTDPSLRNWMGLAIAVRTNEISDFPICNKSFDLSYCGSDL
jgi:Ni,Fe-hydrogenase III large subunit